MNEKNNDGLLTKEQAKKIVLINKGEVHTFYNVNGMLIGGNHSKKSVFKDIDTAYECRLGGECAKAMKHELVVIPSKDCLQKDLLFIETKVIR